MDGMLFLRLGQNGSFIERLLCEDSLKRRLSSFIVKRRDRSFKWWPHGRRTWLTIAFHWKSVSLRRCFIDKVYTTKLRDWPYMLSAVLRMGVHLNGKHPIKSRQVINCLTSTHYDKSLKISLSFSFFHDGCFNYPLNVYRVRKQHTRNLAKSTRISWNGEASGGDD